MPLHDRLMHAGASALLAREVCGTVSTVSAAGTTKADATPLPNAVNDVTVAAANSGVILRSMSPGESQYVFNDATGNTLKVYPPAGGQINNAGADTAVTLANNKAGLFVCLSALAYAYVVSA